MLNFHYFLKLIPIIPAQSTSLQWFWRYINLATFYGGFLKLSQLFLFRCDINDSYVASFDKLLWPAFFVKYLWCIMLQCSVLCIVLSITENEIVDVMPVCISICIIVFKVSRIRYIMKLFHTVSKIRENKWLTRKKAIYLTTITHDVLEYTARQVENYFLGMQVYFYSSMYSFNKHAQFSC